jgi:hypothetical protein
VDRQPIGYMLLKVRSDSAAGPVPAWTQDRPSGFMVAIEAEALAEIAAQLNGTSSSGRYHESVGAYRATHQPGDHYLVGAVVPWQ